ncbi:unnamed protein product [Closterium sp. NIES-53]
MRLMFDSSTTQPHVSSGPAEGGDPSANDIVTTSHSPRLENTPGFPPQSSSPPLLPVAVDSSTFGGGGACGVGSEGADAGGAGSRSAELEGAEFEGAASGGGHLLTSSPQETLSLQQLREWVVSRRTAYTGADSWDAERGGIATRGPKPAVADSGARGT